MASQNLRIATPGDAQQATINVSNALKKSANLTPFNVDGGNYAHFDPVLTGADDLLYGGSGDDFIHGGSGDDGISGAEALAEAYGLNAQRTALVRSDYDRPYNPGDMLRYSPAASGGTGQASRAGKFAAYNEADPLRAVSFNDSWSVAGGWFGTSGSGTARGMRRPCL